MTRPRNALWPMMSAASFTHLDAAHPHNSTISIQASDSHPRSSLVEGGCCGKFGSMR